MIFYHSNNNCKYDILTKTNKQTNRNESFWIVERDLILIMTLEQFLQLLHFGINVRL